MIKMYNDTVVYVACPPYAQTGGPEDLHELAFELRKLGIEAYMYYGGEYNNPVAKEYKKYNLPFVPFIEDSSKNILIVPEIWGHMLNQYTNIQKGFYWLSVDNHFGTQEIDYNDEKITHFAQSYYALDYIQKKQVKNKCYLSDYINEIYTSNPPNTFTNRQDIILYNPSKGYHFTSKIISQAPHLHFVPISGMSKTQIRELCLSSKIYIDFGNHPGKDKLPRETAILGNIVITNKEGAAKFYDDIPIGYEYKFENYNEEIPNIIKRIEYCLTNYDTCINDFNIYRQTILNEKKRFISDIKKVFLNNTITTENQEPSRV